MNRYYPNPPPLMQQRPSPGVRPVMILHVIACLAGMGFCAISGLYSLGVWADMMSADNSPLTLSMAGPYTTATVIAGVGFFLLMERLLAAFDER